MEGSVAASLRNCRYQYEIIRHERPLRTAKEGADYFGITVAQTAPTLIIETDRGYFGLIVTGDRGRVDFAELAAALSCSQAKLADRAKVRMITGYDVGTTPLVGIALPFVFDRRLLTYDFVYGGSGEKDSTLKIDPRALTELNEIVATIE